MLENQIEHLLKQGSINDVLSFDLSLDNEFGFSFQKEEIQDNDPLYRGLDHRALLTSYLDYFQVLSDIPKNESLIDLGAGFCRGTLLSHKMKLARCISIESYAPRISQSVLAIQKMGGDQNDIIQADLNHYSLPKAYGYYLYFPKNECLDVMLKQIIKHSIKDKPCYLYVCESHGDLISYIDSLDETEVLKKMKVSLPRHNDYIYKFKIERKDSCQGSLSSFLLHKKKTDVFLDVSLYHSYFKKKIIWRVCSTQMEHTEFKGVHTVIVNQKRIIDPTQGEEILKVSIGNWSDLDTEKKRIIIDHEIYEEQMSGTFKHLEEITWQESSRELSSL